MTWLSIRAATQFRFLTGGALLGAALVALAACSDTPTTTPVLDPPQVMYGAVVDDGFNVPAINIKKIDPRYLRQVVDTPYSVPGQPGTIVVDPANRFLYLVLAGGKSMRYGIGVGREGFAWAGEATIHDKQHWPKWFPPKEMVERDPRLKPVADGQDGGPRNPLGARALYLWQGNKDTLYRLHGTTDPSSIGTAASSGCVRLFNQDIIDLYERVAVGAKVVVLQAPGEENSLVTEIFGQPLPKPAI